MLTTLDITSTLSINDLEKIYNNLSKNQKKAKNGLAIFELIKFKKEKENLDQDLQEPHPDPLFKESIESSAEKLFPHPQLFTAVGLVILNPPTSPLLVT